MFHRLLLTLALASCFLTSSNARQPGPATPVAPPPMPAAQQAVLSKLEPDVRIYEEFRYWVSFQPREVQAEAFKHYDTFLSQQGVAATERAKRIDVVEKQGRRLEVERWNKILTAEKPAFNTRPNAFLVEMVKDRKPGRALDVGMGQGRNALYLAEQGWQVTGFDPADQAVAAAQAEAKRKGLKLDVQVVGSEDFDWGKERWDLIVLSYVTARPFMSQIIDSLAPGGLVVLEGAHRDSLKLTSIGSGVVYDSNELLRMFDKLRIIRYEDVEAEPDFRPGAKARAVRLAAQKP